ncbi:MAG: hypothetical protein IJF27_07145, partial [Oscillospiraceae bacterium]|nr:hypothetical protein [Oscillospiraceae bacterium]
MKGYDYFYSLSKFGSRPGLERVSKLAELCGRPDRKLNIIHVAGTNGKGSTVSSIAAVLTAAGHKTGCFMSPYVLDPRECILIDGTPLSREQFDEAILAVKPFADMMADDCPTEFELQCVAALKYFCDSGCDTVCLEVGMGGLLDATNFIGTPLLSVICAISIDHTAWLGETLAEIAAHKCGIIKEGGVTVAYPIQESAAFDVIEKTALQKNNTLIIPDTAAVSQLKYDAFRRTSFFYKGIPISLAMPGEHQIYNALTVIEAAMALRSAGFAISNDNITNSINSISLPARVEIFDVPENGSLPAHRVIIDAGHDLQGIEALCSVLDSMNFERPPIAVAGMLADKDYTACAALLARRCRKIFAAPPNSPRAVSAEAFAKAANAGGGPCEVVCCDDIFASLA